ncbi:type II toxin-antitoxin system CcdA family antitoxin [Pseudofrankia saprophytica]|uniref:type II toxin-antitoxin system CcdA family antitoxin n=1 Tax=Pseudofrankia saprophytica TaxID=298655 RepID=UPI000234D3CB|nr:type II toxin-antitoxin system CcdA family antitoxin [Pseudofrankia saprophytica]
MIREPQPQPAKRKVSLTLDADLVAEVESGGESLSAEVNLVLRDELARRRRRRALRTLLERLDEQDGPLDTAEDEEEIARYMRLLGGPADDADQPAARRGPVR